MTSGDTGPLVSAVIIFCNEIEYLAEAVESVYDQTMTDWELVLVDDGSCDGSTDLARRLAAERPDRVRYIDHPGHRCMGMSASRNRGVTAASGRYVAYLDADDRWLPEKLERQLALFDAHPEVGIVYGPLTRWYSWTGRAADRQRDDLYGIHGDGFTLRTPRSFQPPELVSLLIRHKDLVPSGALFRRELFLEVGGAESEFTDNYEDAVAWVKMGLRAAAYCADQSWYLYRQYPEDADRRRRAESRPDPERPRGDVARLRFLDWVERYLADGDLGCGPLDRALRDARRQILHPHHHRIRRSVSRGSAWAARSSLGAGRLALRHGKLAATRRLTRMPMAQITDEFGFSLDPGGWQPYVEALREYDRDPTVPAEATTYGRFLLDPDVNAVRTLNDLLDLSRQPAGYRWLPPFWLGTYPWGGLLAHDVGGPGPAFGWAYDEAEGVDTAELWGRGRTLWYRPDNLETIRNEWLLTVGLYPSIKRRYSPVEARGFPRVTIVRRADGERRGVIVDGHHRLAVLAHLGVSRVTVEIEATVDVAEAEDWYHVRRGHCSAVEAARFLDAFFVLDGSERFERVSQSWGMADVE